MPNTASSSFKKKEQEQEKQELLESLRQTREELRWARNAFNNAVEPELVEACVYEINALQARYAYFLRQAREQKAEEGAGSIFRLPR